MLTQYIGWLLLIGLFIFTAVVIFAPSTKPFEEPAKPIPPTHYHDYVTLETVNASTICDEDEYIGTCDLRLLVCITCGDVVNEIEEFKKKVEKNRVENQKRKEIALKILEVHNKDLS